MRLGHTLTMLMKQCLNTIEYLENKIKPLPPESQLSDFHHPSEAQKSELLFVAVCTGTAAYALYKYFK